VSHDGFLLPTIERLDRMIVETRQCIGRIDDALDAVDYGRDRRAAAVRQSPKTAAPTRRPAAKRVNSR
jgi:hypothetical protein